MVHYSGYSSNAETAENNEFIEKLMFAAVICALVAMVIVVFHVNQTQNTAIVANEYVQLDTSNNGIR